MTDAPFLTGLRRAEPAEPTELLADEASSGQPAGAGSADDGFDPDDFPAWYRDRVSDDADDAESSQDSEPVDPMAWVDALAAVKTLDALDFGAVTILAGDNGTGKSTIVEAIAVAAGFNAEGGSRNFLFSTWDSHSPLSDELVLEWKRRPRWGWFLRAETFYAMASFIASDLLIQEIYPELHHMSHGESFLAVADIRFRGEGLYIFDEPESALSIQGQRRLVEIMQGSLAKGSQFIVSTHSPLLMSFPGATVIEVDESVGLRSTNFEDLASTRSWRSFWDDPQAWHQ